MVTNPLKQWTNNWYLHILQTLSRRNTDTCANHRNIFTILLLLLQKHVSLKSATLRPDQIVFLFDKLSLSICQALIIGEFPKKHLEKMISIDQFEMQSKRYWIYTYVPRSNTATWKWFQGWNTINATGVSKYKTDIYSNQITLNAGTSFSLPQWNLSFLDKFMKIS